VKKLELLGTFLRNRGAAVGLAVLALVGVAAASAGFVFPYSPWDMRGAPFMQPGEMEFVLGSDSLGRDVAAGIAYGARVSLLIGAVSTLVAVVLGITLGAVAGYAGGVVDDAIMRFTEFFQTVPSFMLAVVLVAIFSPSLGSIVAAIAIVSWPPVARVIRAEFLSLRSREFVHAAEVLGRSRTAIVFREILPNALSPIIVNATFGVAQAIILESGLSFLGLGVRPPAASWGNMLSEAQSITVLSSQPWIWIPPGLMILFAVLSINFVGDGLRDSMESRSHT
jgi:peptide/nickel transport system permease protein